MTNSDLHRQLYIVRSKLIDARNVYTDSILWLWHARRNGCLSKIDSAIATLDEIIKNNWQTWGEVLIHD